MDFVREGLSAPTEALGLLHESLYGPGKAVPDAPVCLRNLLHFLLRKGC
jgi:hypothetical protein